MNNSNKMNIILIVLISIFVSHSDLKSIDFITNPELDKHLVFMNAEIYEDDIYFITRKDFENGYKLSVLGFFKYTNNNEFIEMPSTYIENGEEKKIYTANPCIFIVNSKGEFYLTGHNGLFRFSKNKWEKIEIEDYYEKTIITGMTVDIYDNLWFTTSITNSNEIIEKSQLIKLEKNSFKVIQTTSSAHSFFSALYSINSTNMIGLKDGRVALHRQWFGNINDGERAQYNSHDLWIFDQDGNYETDLIISSAGMPDYKEQGFENPFQKNKNVTYLFEDDNSDIYVALRPIVYKGLFNGQIYDERCCGGLTRFNSDGTWRPFKEEDGLPLFDRVRLFEDYNPVMSISKLSDGTIIFVGLKGLFSINSDDKINLFNPKLIYDNAKLITIESFVEDEEFYKANFGDFFHIEKDGPGFSWSPNGPGFTKIFKKSNSDFVLFYNYGILIINESHLQTISNVEILNQNDINIYPNPSSDFISVGSNYNNFDYEIVDLLGNIVLFGKYIEQIDISNLSYGHYYLKILNDDEPKLLKFIKK